MSKKLLGIGAAALTVGMLMFGMAQTTGGSTAYAGSDDDDDVCVTFTPTRTNTRTPTGTPPTNTPVAPTNTPVPPTATLEPLTINDAPGDNLSAFGNETPQRTCEATVTNTPTSTLTPVPGTTTVPTTAPAVTNTPTGGSQGGGVAPPNTGFGDTGSDSSSTLWFLLAGAALVATGSGAILAGARRRS